MTETPASVDRRKVFVIHGRNEAARRAIFEFLRSLGLDPIEWSSALAMTGSASPYIGDVLDAAFGAAQAVVVLQTPDDVAYLHESLTSPDDPETQPQMQPRPNVLFEAGMAMGRQPERTVIVELGRVKSFSDIHGRHAVRLDNSFAKRQDLANRLRTAGCDVNTTGADWHVAGDLTPPSPPGNGLPMGRKLPSSTVSGLPRLTARLNERGGNTLSDIVVTNHGPGDVINLDAHPGDDVEPGFLRRDAETLPIPRLPAGKSVAVLQRLPVHFGGASKGYFTVKLSATTLDGTPIELDEFVSGA
ncbi:TIR domain-containing protein [Cellulosimicrobium cellulans]|uniref:TIR domain-containing protein n=1 Tax=Cellulosimicrobium cellulans TaxID=1710 RepID=UPI0036E999EA